MNRSGSGRGIVNGRIKSLGSYIIVYYCVIVNCSSHYYSLAIVFSMYRRKTYLFILKVITT